MDSEGLELEPEGYELAKPEADTVESGFGETSRIDIGVNEFNGRDKIVVYIRPSYAQATKWLVNAGGLESMSFEAEAGELNARFLDSLDSKEKCEFNFKTSVTPICWGYIFDMNHKTRLYDLVKGLGHN